MNNELLATTEELAKDYSDAIRFGAEDTQNELFAEWLEVIMNAEPGDMVCSIRCL